ncbi:unnamed protein product [Heterobilharzia americana]|nr:unnamed protein product [Heterobilharzia americana]
MNTVLGRAEHLFVMLLGYLISLVFGSLFLLGIVSTESKIYVVRNQPFDGLVESFPDAVSLFGPEIFHRDHIHLLHVKVLNAQRSGYTGVIVFNTIDDKIFPMNGRKHIDQIMIPSVMVDKKAGLKLMNYSVNNRSQEFMINMVSFYGLPLKYILLSLLIVVGVSLLILVISFVVHLCRFWRRIHRGRLSRRHLRQLVIKRFTKGLDSYDVCSICLEDYN